MPENIHPIFDQMVSPSERIAVDGYEAKVFWLTGLSGSGKSTIGKALERKLFEDNYKVILLDGDNIRTGISNNLTFSQEDRKENIRRIAEVSKLFLQSNTIVLASFISPTKEIRQFAREIVGSHSFHEIFVKASLEKCEERDVKGLYKKARAGEIKQFTGIDAPYEEPIAPQLVIDTEDVSVAEAANRLADYVFTQVRTAF